MLIFDEILPSDAEETILQEPGVMQMVNANEVARNGSFIGINKIFWRRATFENGYPLITDTIND